MTLFLLFLVITKFVVAEIVISVDQTNSSISIVNMTPQAVHTLSVVKFFSFPWQIDIL